MASVCRERPSRSDVRDGLKGSSRIRSCSVEDDTSICKSQEPRTRDEYGRSFVDEIYVFVRQEKYSVLCLRR